MKFSQDIVIPDPVEEIEVAILPARVSAVIEEYDIEAIEEAVYLTAWNLYNRYRCYILLDKACLDPGDNMFTVYFYKQKDKELSIGHHFSGVSRHLKKYHPDIVKRYKVGTRLFRHIVMDRRDLE